jgi:hypothetical protein
MRFRAAPWVRPDLPAGQIRSQSVCLVSSLFGKNIWLVPSGKSGALVRASTPQGGVAHVTNAGWDAVDAEARFDETR